MVTRKCIICGSTRTVLKWPFNKDHAEKWTERVRNHYPNRVVGKSSGICYKHFNADDFIDYDGYVKGKSKGEDDRLRYHSGALPIIDPPSERAPVAKKRRMSHQCSPPRAEFDIYTSTPSTSKVKSATNDSFNWSDEDIKDTEDAEYNPDTSFIEYAKLDALEDEEFEESWKSLKSSFAFNVEKPWTETKFIVPWSFLVWVFSCCRFCGEKENIVVNGTPDGAALLVEVICNACGNSYSKTTSDRKNRTSLLNYLISCSILFTGSIASKVFRLFQVIGIKMMTRRNFISHQKKFLNKVVADVWSHQQKDVVAVSRRNRNLTVGGDARCDSMGHSAKYGCYSTIDIDQNKILSIQLVQTQGNSNAMEAIGFQKSLKHLIKTLKLPIKNFVSDRHIQIRKIMRETYGANRQNKNELHINHYLDPWHVAKSLKKDLAKVSKLDPSTLITKWSPAITNHMYWVASSTQPSMVTDRAGMVEAKWTSLCNHLVNRHKHDSTLYPRCAHSARKRGERKRKYFKTGTPEYELVCDVISNERRIKDIRQLSPLGETSSLESYHSVVNQFAPKMYHFGYRAMNSRIKLAALHFNNQKRPDIRRLQVTYPKHKKGEATVRAVSDPASYEYIDMLLEKAYKMEPDTCADSIPEPMAALYSKPDNPDELKRNFTSRFSRKS